MLQKKHSLQNKGKISFIVKKINLDLVPSASFCYKKKTKKSEIFFWGQGWKKMSIDSEIQNSLSYKKSIFQ